MQMRASASPPGTGYHTCSRVEIQKSPLRKRACLLKSLWLLVLETPANDWPCVHPVLPLHCAISFLQRAWLLMLY